MAGIAVFLSQVALMNMEQAKFRGVGYHEPALPWHLGPSSHPIHEMIVVTAGSQTVAIKGRKIRAEPGDILLYPPGVAHEEWAESGQTFSSYFFGFSWPDAPGDMPLIVNDRHGRVRLLLDWLYKESRAPSTLSPAVCQSLFQAVLGQFLRLWLYHDDELVERIRGYVLEHIGDPASLQCLAAFAGISKYYFVRKYKELTGRTPMEDVRVLRIERAREMIMTSDQPIKAVSEAVGFSSVYHMCRLFKKQLGIPPGRLRSRLAHTHRPSSRS